MYLTLTHMSLYIYSFTHVFQNNSMRQVFQISFTDNRHRGKLPYVTYVANGRRS